MQMQAQACAHSFTHLLKGLCELSQLYKSLANLANHSLVKTRGQHQTTQSGSNEVTHVHDIPSLALLTASTRSNMTNVDALYAHLAQTFNNLCGVAFLRLVRVSKQGGILIEQESENYACGNPRGLLLSSIKYCEDFSE